MSAEKQIIHMDQDAFFVSVEVHIKKNMVYVAVKNIFTIIEMWYISDARSRIMRCDVGLATTATGKTMHDDYFDVGQLFTQYHNLS